MLYFIPQLRAYFLSTVPDANLEFSLLDELALCFRMLASESGHACQATNLLKALRQSREATGLGLLEGHAQKGARAADIEVGIALLTLPVFKARFEAQIVLFKLPVFATLWNSKTSRQRYCVLLA